jgi:polyhydroxybutyrate depolymerase
MIAKAAVAALLAVGVAAAVGSCRSAADRSPSPGLGAGKSDHAITVDGRSRAYHLYVPAGLTGPAPLVVMLHGGFGSGGQAETSYGWDEQADTGHFVVAYPDGLNRAWNVGGGCCGEPGRTGVDDVAFITAMVGEIGRLTAIDPARVYATGISNGGMLAYRLACDAAVFVAIAPDSATLLGPCASPTVSVLHIHGTADENIPYGGGQGNGVAKINGPAVVDVVAQWRRIDGCAEPATVTSGAVTRATASCPHGRTVELITIAGAGHQWPGAAGKPAAEKLLGLDPPSTALDATSTIWAFFAGL